jgi:hypothetical protein
MSYSDPKWRDAAIHYVDKGDDTPLRDLVADYRRRQDRSAVIAGIRREQDARIDEEYVRALATRVPTGYVAKDLRVPSPAALGMSRYRAYRGDATPEQREWASTHTWDDRSGLWTPNEFMCQAKDRVGKYRMPDAFTGETVLFCETDSKLNAAQIAIKTVGPEFKDRWAALDAGAPIWPKDVVTRNRP